MGIVAGAGPGRQGQQGLGEGAIAGMPLWSYRLRSAPSNAAPQSVRVAEEVGVVHDSEGLRHATADGAGLRIRCVPLLLPVPSAIQDGRRAVVIRTRRARAV